MGLIRKRISDSIVVTVVRPLLCWDGVRLL